MLKESFDIQFAYYLSGLGKAIHLLAEVDAHIAPIYYYVKNIRPQFSPVGSILPDLKIVCREGVWVVLDSNRPSTMCELIGEQIDKYEKRVK